MKAKMENEKLSEVQLKNLFTQLYDSVELLSLEYELQCKKSSLPVEMIPDDVATEWDYILGISKQLSKNEIIDSSILKLLEDIDKNFLDVSLNNIFFEEIIWTGEGLKTHNFWNKQRELAKLILLKLNKLRIQ